MNPRLNFPIPIPIAAATLILALFAGPAMWPGTSVLGQDDQPAKTDAAATPPAEHAAKEASGRDVEQGNRTGHVNVKDFSQLAVDGDWSAAIQAAIDHVTAKHGYENGTTILFPPGTYRVNKTIRLGKDRAITGRG